MSPVVVRVAVRVTVRVAMRVAVEIRFTLNCSICICSKHQAITAYVRDDETELHGFYTLDTGRRVANQKKS
jgi:hypothetical protein